MRLYKELKATVLLYGIFCYSNSPFLPSNLIVVLSEQKHYLSGPFYANLIE